VVEKNISAGTPAFPPFLNKNAKKDDKSENSC